MRLRHPSSYLNKTWLFSNTYWLNRAYIKVFSQEDRIKPADDYYKCRSIDKKKNQKTVSHKVQRLLMSQTHQDNTRGLAVSFPLLPCVWLQRPFSQTPLVRIWFPRLCSTLSHPPYQLQCIHIWLQSWMKLFILTRVYQRAFIFLNHFCLWQSLSLSTTEKRIQPAMKSSIWETRGDGIGLAFFAGMPSSIQYLKLSVRTFTNPRHWFYCSILKRSYTNKEDIF